MTTGPGANEESAPQSSYRVRSLVEEDLPSLRALYHALIDEDAGYRRAPGEYGDHDLASFARWNLRVLDNPNNAYLVAVTWAHGGESVIGFIRFMQNSSRRRTRHTGFLTLGVQEESRSKGVGQALWDALLSVLKNTKIERLSLQVFADNQRARRFYERIGFTASGTLPGEIKMEDGRYRDLILMHRWIT